MSYIPTALTVEQLRGITTPQQLFDIVATHLLKQKTQSMISVTSYFYHDSVNSTHEICAYRSGDGQKMCALGILIPDELYDKTKMETKGAEKILSYLNLPSSLNQLAGRLQHVHDDYDGDEWEEQLQYVADEFELTFNPPSRS